MPKIKRARRPARNVPRRYRTKPTKALVELMQQPSVLEVNIAPSTPGLDWILEGKPYLPVDYNERKGLPIVEGVLDYFPLALLQVAKVSLAGNQQHNPGEPLHWARGKSMDQVNTAVRHVMERGGLDTDGVPHLAKAIWRLCAALQIDEEKRLGLPPSRACWV